MGVLYTSQDYSIQKMDWNGTQVQQSMGQKQARQPSLDQIYDLTTQQLRDLQSRYQSIPTQKLTPQQQQLLEVISIELEQRKTIDFFTEMLAIDNPYLNKFDQFKDQFLKLASQAIHQQQNHANQQPSQQQSKQTSNQLSSINKPQTFQISNTKNSFKEKPIEQSLKLPKIQKQPNQDTSRVTKVSRKLVDRHEEIKTPLSGTRLSNINNNPSVTTTTLSETDNDSVSTLSVDKKMGIGSKRKKKQIKQIIRETLLKSQGQTYVIGGKSNNRTTNSPNKNLVSSHLTNNQKNKSPPKIQQKQDQKKINKPKKQVLAKQALQKIKNAQKKSETASKPPKPQKGFSSKKLVQMIKQEEQQKRQKKIRGQREESQRSMEGAKELQKVEEAPHRSQAMQKDRSQAMQKEEQILEEIDVKQTGNQNNKESQNNQIVQQVVGQRQNEKEVQKGNWGNEERIVPHEQGSSQDGDQMDVIEQQALEDSTGAKILQTQSKNARSKGSAHSSSDKDKEQQPSTQYHGQSAVDEKPQGFKRQQLKNSVIGIPVQKQKKTTNDRISQPNSQNVNQPNFTGRLEEFNSQFQRINSNPNLKLISNYQCSNVNEEKNNLPKKTHQLQRFQYTPLSLQLQKTQQKDRKNDEDKKYYNQQYWVHIREEAEHKISLFKQKKQIQERQKDRVTFKPQSEQANQGNSNEDEQQQRNQEETNDKKGTEVGRKTQSKFSSVSNEEKSLQSSRTNNIPTKTRTNFSSIKKGNLNPVLPIKRPIRVKPEFNYLQVFPSFNHLFSIMYTKDVGQALLDLPAVMREVSGLFNTHKQKLNRDGIVFQPSIFMPFDCPYGMIGGMAACDPKRLLMHTENTYVDLKSIVQRLKYFNMNVHGDYSQLKGSAQHESLFQYKNTRYYRVIKTKEEVYDIITSSFMRRLGWKELPHGCSLKTTWNLFWSWGKPDLDMNKLLSVQRINHFPFNKNLSRKDLLYRNLDSFRKNYRVSMPFLPQTFILPKQFSSFTAKFHQEARLSPHNYWIMKPIGKSRGRGIKVVSNLAQLNYIDNIVVQKYITNPLLIEGYKFDMRVYVLVTSFHPLEAFLYKEGFARFSTEKYSLQPSSIKNTFIHLTNFSINRHNTDAKDQNSEQNLEFKSGSKISFKMLKDKLTRMGYSYSSIWSQIQYIVIKSLIACSVHVPQFPCSFELFGYDIMIDSQEECHLIEINSSPSLQRAYMLDEVVKQALIDDIIDIVDPPAFDKEEFMSVVSERLTRNTVNMSKKKNPEAEEEDLIDLGRIFKCQPMRKLGEKPQKIGLFQMIAPCPMSIEMEKVIKSKSSTNNMHNID